MQFVWNALGGVANRVSVVTKRLRLRAEKWGTTGVRRPCRLVLAACPHFSSSAAPYNAVSLLRNRHACTILASMLRQNVDVQYQREVSAHARGICHPRRLVFEWWDTYICYK